MCWRESEQHVTQYFGNLTWYFNFNLWLRVDCHYYKLHSPTNNAKYCIISKTTNS